MNSMAYMETPDWLMKDQAAVEEALMQGAVMYEWDFASLKFK
jgi:hypothetical protein